MCACVLPCVGALCVTVLYCVGLDAVAVVLVLLSLPLLLALSDDDAACGESNPAAAVFNSMQEKQTLTGKKQNERPKKGVYGVRCMEMLLLHESPPPPPPPLPLKDNGKE